MAAPAQFTEYIDKNADKFIDRLAKAVAIPSVSGDASYRKHVFEMADFLKSELEALGVKVKLVPLGKQVLDGQEIDLPPAILGEIGNDKSKKTVGLYAHYDVQPPSSHSKLIDKPQALLSDGWDTDPFVLKVDEKTGRLIGRGSSDDKGPLLGWINVLEAHVKQGIELPVNLKFCLEGKFHRMEESGSEGLDDLINSEVGPGKFFDGVDCVCISDNYWLNTRTPCLTYGLRGICYYKINVSGPAKDLHSGVFGRMVHEPMTDLIHIMSKLVTPQGDILVPGINELVAPLTEEERKRYESLDYSIDDVHSSAGAEIAVSSSISEVLMNRMRYPSLSLHGIEGAFYAAGAKTVIPARVAGKFSIRLVPDMLPVDVDRLVTEYIKSIFNQLNSKNKLEVESLHGGKPWVADPNHWNYVAAAKATETVYGRKPDLTREGGSIPVTLTFAEALGVNVLLLPMGRGDDGAHSTNEKLDRSNYIKGTKLLGTYLWEVSKVTEK
ncbi:Cys-Gly metallodipeptidase dug1; AltName: Full=GSH degradosomal complex subunit DUG1 [Serendipita indica DSM 11827]|nr:Cys-Gly metallodipeptidase dug1; AltName: Full=GSH degradosomal complex subunit DUG1 [Serendipita indica DSM 11827]